MRRLAALLLLLLGLAVVTPPAFAQETKSSESSGKSGSAGGEGNLQGWKWANFLVLAGALGYLIGKHGGPFFNSRARKIRDDMDEASRLLRESEARVAEAERKLAGLETALAALKEETRIEAEAEAQRAARRTEEEIAKIQAQAELDIASAGKAARKELRQFASRLAIDLAEQKIRAGLTPPAQEALVADFAACLGAANPSGAPRPEAR